VAQDDYYYEIQLTNKQLVFYFMAGAAGLILSFLAGVMVGRGVDTAASADGATQRLADERVISEEPVATPAPEYSYPERLEADRPEAALERPRPAATATPAAATPKPTRVASTPAATPAPTPAARTTPTPKPAARSTELPNPLPSVTAPGHAVQVGAYKDQESASNVTQGLKKKGFPAFVSAPAAGSGGLYTVRVGPYRDRADADVVADRLRAEKFQPYIVKQ